MKRRAAPRNGGTAAPQERLLPDCAVRCAPGSIRTHEASLGHGRLGRSGPCTGGSDLI
jgi:hypothetical protein